MFLLLPLVAAIGVGIWNIVAGLMGMARHRGLSITAKRFDALPTLAAQAAGTEVMVTGRVGAPNLALVAPVSRLPAAIVRLRVLETKSLAQLHVFTARREMVLVDGHGQKTHVALDESGVDGALETTTKTWLPSQAGDDLAKRFAAAFAIEAPPKVRHARNDSVIFEESVLAVDDLATAVGVIASEHKASEGAYRDGATVRELANGLDGGPPQIHIGTMPEIVLRFSAPFRAAKNRTLLGIALVIGGVGLIATLLAL